VPNFIAIALWGAYPQICEILRFCDFFVVLSCSVLVVLIFSRNCAQVEPLDGFIVYGSNDASSPKDVPFWVWMMTHNFKGLKPTKNPQKGPCLGIFQQNWQKLKAISPTGEHRISTKF